MDIIYKFSDLKEEAEYIPDNERTGAGQLKLLIMEMWFLSYIKFKLYNILYIGSSPGDHINLLYKFFKKNINLLILIDGRKSNVIDEKNIIKIQKYVGWNEDDTHISYKNIAGLLDDKPLIFISDIRSNKDGKEPTIEDLLNDYLIQTEISIIFNPDLSLLKFRYPWPNEFTKDMKEKIEKVKIPLDYNCMFMQPFLKKDSCELRYIRPKGQLIKKTLNKKESIFFEKRLAHYNRFVKKDVELANYYLTNPAKVLKISHDKILTYLINNMKIKSEK